MRVDFGIELGPVDKCHVELIRGWRNQYAIWRWARQNDFISDVQQADWYERQAKDPGNKTYLIQSNVDGGRTPLGVCALAVDWPNRRAEFSVYIEPWRQRRGFGRQALTILLNHGFQNLGLAQIWGETFEGNPAAKLFESLGFSKDGTRRAFYWKDGAFQDSHLYSLLRDEWTSKDSLSPAS